MMVCGRDNKEISFEETGLGEAGARKTGAGKTGVEEMSIWITAA
jgi:hypothetical protein